jgi:hypothetical protein
MGSGLVIVSVVFDLFIRLRMRLTAGDKQAFLRNGPDWAIYGRYRAAGIRNGWATWPIYAMWTFLALGIVVFAAGLVVANLGSK